MFTDTCWSTDFKKEFFGILSILDHGFDFDLYFRHVSLIKVIIIINPDVFIIYIVLKSINIIS